jgi:hypothetical protein
MPPQALHKSNPLTNVYAAQNPIYVPGGLGLQTQGSFVHGQGQGYLTPQIHTGSIPTQGTDGYVRQGAGGPVSHPRACGGETELSDG